MKRIRNFILQLSAVLILFSGCSEKQMEEESTETSIISTVATNETQVNNDSIAEETPVYPTPTNTELSYGFLDHNLFSQYWTGGTLRCGIDFPPGDYYIFSLYGADALYDVVDNPNDFSWSYHRMMRKVHVENGQYVRANGSILVSADEVDTNNWVKYGVFLVGKDLPEGDYQVVTITDRYNTEIQHISGVRGAYQINEGSPENDPIDCTPLFDNQHYISLKNGQYLIINNAKLTLCGTEKTVETEVMSAETTSPTQEVSDKKDISATYDAFLTATNLMVSDLTLNDNGKYYYNDLIILSQDTEQLSMYTYLDSEPQINQGALYRTIAKYLDGYEMMLNNGKSYSATLLGFEVSGTDFAPYAENAGKFISLEDSLFNVLTKFSQLESAEGNFDFVNNSFSFSVPDLTACAKEMMISEEMLGYIFAMLDEYAPTISFDGNSCYFEYEYPG